MKNYILFIVCSVLFVSCEDNYAIPLELTTKQVFTLETKPNDWVLNEASSGESNYYSCHFNLSGLTKYNVSTGAVMAYIDYDSYQQTLPYTRYFFNEDGENWTRTIDFDFSYKDINFYVTSTDSSFDPPETMIFKVVYIW